MFFLTQCCRVSFLVVLSSLAGSCRTAGPSRWSLFFVVVVVVVSGFTEKSSQLVNTLTHIVYNCFLLLLLPFLVWKNSVELSFRPYTRNQKPKLLLLLLLLIESWG